MRIRLHHSFAARLIAGGVVLVLCVLGGVSAFLLISRVQQTGSVAVSNADNRAQVVKGLLERLTAPTGRNVATDIARSGPLATALGPPASASAVNQLFGTGTTQMFNARPSDDSMADWISILVPSALNVGWM